MKTEIVKVTPALAKKYLETNTDNNRRVKPRRVDFYATEMIEGRWVEMTGESLKFDKAGKLIDGQHRLLALIKANKTYHFLVVTNLAKETFEVIDTGSNRSTADIFHISGVKNGHQLSAGVKFYAGLTAGYLDPHTSSKADLKLSNKMLLDIYEQEPEYWQDWCKKAVRWYNGFSKILPGSFILGFAVLLNKHSKHKGKIDDFFEELCMDLAMSSPIRTLRKVLVEDKLKRSEKLPPSFKLIYLMKTWNAYVTGKDMKTLKFQADEPQPKPL